MTPARNRLRSLTVLMSISVWSIATTPVSACTGVTLKAKDGSVVFGRTQEWGTFDLRSRVAIVPRGLSLHDKMPDGKDGLSWTTTYGTVGLDVLDEDLLIDGMNEKGLTANLFYHEGYTEYAKPEAGETLSILALVPYVLTSCQSVDEVRDALAKVNVIGVDVPEISGPPPLHMAVTDASGKMIVVEFVNGVTTIHDAPLGVVTNGPTYDWHMENVRNYVNLDVPLPKRKITDLRSIKFGAGNRLYGLPGDLASPSRFLRVAAYASTARPTPDGKETMYEVFRILDNFNLSVGASAEGGGHSNPEGMRSATIWTTVYDTKNRVMYYHTMHNRRVRQVDLTKIDFDAGAITRLPLDREKQQDIEDVTPKQ